MPRDDTILHKRTPRSKLIVRGKEAVKWGVGIMAGAGLVHFICNEMFAGRIFLDYIIYTLLALFGVGLIFMLYGVSDWRQTALLKKHQKTVWVTDYHWDENRIKDDLSGILARDIGIIAVLGVLLIGFNVFVITLRSGNMRFGLGIPLVFANIAMLFFGIQIARSSRQFPVFGPAYFFFDSFPFFLGDRLSGIVKAKKGFGELQLISLDLMCIKESDDFAAPGGVATVSRYSCRRIYSTWKEIPDPDRLDEEISVSFDLPPDKDLSTLLDKHPSIYWELDIKAETTKGLFQRTFLVPVYYRSDDTPQS